MMVIVDITQNKVQILKEKQKKRKTNRERVRVSTKDWMEAGEIIGWDNDGGRVWVFPGICGTR